MSCCGGSHGSNHGNDQENNHMEHSKQNNNTKSKWLFLALAIILVSTVFYIMQ